MESVTSWRENVRIFVGNFSSETDEDELRATFAEHGEVTSVQIVRERDTGESRGFAFIDMPSVSEGQAAINELDGSELKGRSLKVNEARPPAQNRRPPGGHQSGRGRDGRRRHGKKPSRKRGGFRSY